MSIVLDELSRSDDPIDRAVAVVLRANQDQRAADGLPRHLGYEPREIRKHGAVAVIESRIRKSTGYDGVPATDTYEAIVCEYPDRFSEDIVAIARTWVAEGKALFGPTADPQELDEKVRGLLDLPDLPFPKGRVNPERKAVSATAFMRDPWVKAYVLKLAAGCCEACGNSAPFTTPLGLDYLEVHHMRPLAKGGSDRVQNAVALCPNCHRALHNASDAAKRADQMYGRVERLVRE